MTEINPKAIKILLLTGSSPEFGNQAQRERAYEFQRRHQIFIPPYSENIVSSHKLNLELANAVLMMGNNYGRATYGPRHKNKIRLIRNVTPFSIQNKISFPNRFLFMSSVGQIHRGLDLVLDAFAKTNNDLTVCSFFKKEPEFYTHYENVFRRANVDGQGFVKTTHANLTRLFAQSSFAILPSCSEGLSSSLINQMTMGLIPIYTRACGLPFEDIGVCLDFVDVSAIESAVDKLLGYSASERKQHSDLVVEKAQIFQPTPFKDQFKQTLADLL